MSETGHFQAWVIRFVGPRGSGKSLLLALYGLIDLMRGRKVWSNMPIVMTEEYAEWGYRHLPAAERRKWVKKVVGLKSTPLDWDAFYALSEDLTEGTVMIDEAQYFCDSRAALALKNRLLNAIVAQVRKRNLNLYYTVKQGDWVDRRLGYETDIEIECSGMQHTDWGKENNVQPGDMVFTRCYDLSGAMTGHPIDPKRKWFQSYKAGYFKHLHHLWGCYDTSAVVDLEEAFTNIKLDLKQRVITNKPTSGDILTSLREVGKSLLDRGTQEITTTGFWGVAQAMGIEGTPQNLGKYLPELGITRKQKHGGSYYYDLSNLE